MVRVGVVAVDGTKVHANASERATRDYEQIAREILEEAAEVDAAEDEQFGERRGDELPPALSTREGRQRWLRDARRRLDQQRAEEARPIPRSRAKRHWKRAVGLKRSSMSSGARTPTTRPIERAGG